MCPLASNLLVNVLKLILLGSPQSTEDGKDSNCVKTIECFHMLNCLPLAIQINNKHSLWQAPPCFQVFRLGDEK